VNPFFILAYLDLGSGSFIIQIVVASLLGSALLIRTFWKQILGIFRRGAVTQSDDSLDE
jgi:hypothetical protein